MLSNTYKPTYICNQPTAFQQEIKKQINSFSKQSESKSVTKNVVQNL